MFKNPGRDIYKRGYSNPLLKFITVEHGLYVMREIHEGVCGNHDGKRSLLHKIVRQGYYWSDMAKDAGIVRLEMRACQRFCH